MRALRFHDARIASPRPVASAITAWVVALAQGLLR
jgi:hypothetical protein